jgi:hypothetical protein
MRRPCKAACSRCLKGRGFLVCWPRLLLAPAATGLGQYSTTGGTAPCEGQGCLLCSRSGLARWLCHPWESGIGPLRDSWQMLLRGRQCVPRVALPRDMSGVSRDARWKGLHRTQGAREVSRAPGSWAAVLGRERAIERPSVTPAGHHWQSTDRRLTG